jgi:hypothetical protein
MRAMLNTGCGVRPSVAVADPPLSQAVGAGDGVEV